MRGSQITGLLLFVALGIGLFGLGWYALLACIIVGVFFQAAWYQTMTVRNAPQHFMGNVGTSLFGVGISFTLAYGVGWAINSVF